MLDYRVILAGAIPAALIALTADFGMSALEKYFMRERKS
jgi:ABC-type proline/glycine betaine transport system permease subunit